MELRKEMLKKIEAMNVLLYLLLMYLFEVKHAIPIRNINAISDVEYNILLKKVKGEFTTPVSERTREENKVLRKYYRWISQNKDVRVGPSGRTIYVDGRQLIRKEELNRTIKALEKESKNSGARKLTQRIKDQFVGCSEKVVASSKLTSTAIMVILYFLFFINHTHKIINLGIFTTCRFAQNVRTVKNDIFISTGDGE